MAEHMGSEDTGPTPHTRTRQVVEVVVYETEEQLINGEWIEQDSDPVLEEVVLEEVVREEDGRWNQAASDRIDKAYNDLLIAGGVQA